MDIREKKERLSSISDEVKELHPLLQVLFNHLPGITRVEYTHGNTEFGADFVLFRTDATFGDTEYVGVIAKTDRIKQDDTADIERQVDEIETRRFVMNGKKEVFVSEVWVVTSGHISQNAMQRIFDKFRSKKIKFLDPDRLIELIDRYSSNYWTNVQIELADLLRTIHTNNEEADKRYSIIPVLDQPVYVDQDVYETFQTRYSEVDLRQISKRKAIDLYQHLEQHSFLLVEGGMGSGKSKLLRRIVAKYSEPSAYLRTEFVPVSATFAELLDVYHLDLDAIVQAKLEDFASRQDLKIRPLLLIDALDEKQIDPDCQLEYITKVYAQAQERPTYSVVLFSRFLANSINEKWCLSSCNRLEIAPLTLKKTIAFLEAICRSLNISSRLIEDIKKSALFKELPRSPIAAILLGKLLTENSTDLPTNLTELYAKFTELSLGRWDVDKGLMLQKEYEVVERVLTNLAEVFIDSNVDTIAVADFKAMLNKYILDRNMEVDGEALYSKLIKRTDFLREDRTAGSIFFSHRTFIEFLYAKAKRFGTGISIDSKAFQVYWMNVYFFYIGLLKDCPKVIQDLVELKPQNESEAWLKLINMGNYFLAANQTPYNVVEANLYRVLLMAAELYLSIVKHDFPSVFAGFSEIGLLWWTQLVTRDAFSYNYFHRAVDATILNIEESRAKDEAKLYALFLLSVIDMELGSTDAFNYLIQTYKAKLPINLQFGVYYEGKKITDATKVVKKQIRHYRQKFSNFGKHEIAQLHDIPIGQPKSENSQESKE